MSWGGRLVSLFPSLHLLLVLSGIAIQLIHPQWWSLPALAALIYLFPLLSFRFHQLAFPLTEGRWDLSKREYNRWWASYMFQYAFNAIPALEALLHFIPGLYSCWLRAWGSRIGKNILWTPRVDVLDRSLLEIDDDVVIGHLTTMVCHTVNLIDGKPMLLTMKIKIGARSLIGADSQLGPGTMIPPKTTVPLKSRLYWKGQWT